MLISAHLMQGPGACGVWSQGAIHLPYWASRPGMSHPLLPEEHENSHWFFVMRECGGRGYVLPWPSPCPGDKE